MTINREQVRRYSALHYVEKPPLQMMSLGGWPWSPSNSSKFAFHTKANTGGMGSPNQNMPQNQQTHLHTNSLHSWDFDNQKDPQ
jgi:hypothetical protein